MTTKIATSITTGNTADVIEHIAGFLPRELGAKPTMTLVFTSTKQPLAEVLPALSSRLGGVVLGASTSGEFTEKGDHKGSVSVFSLHGDFKVFSGFGSGLKANLEGAVASAVAGIPASVEGYPHRVAILLLDPLAGNGEEATLVTAGFLGGVVRLAGGAAGDDLAMHETFVGDGAHVASDALAVAVIFSKAPLGIGVAHGHRALSEPLRVTRAQGNVVHEIEGKPAWDVWAKETRASARSLGIDTDALTPETLGAYLLRYEAGLATGSNYKIRAPLGRGEDGSLSFACGIPQGTVIRITESDSERQVASAREAARSARQQLGGAEPAGGLVFDCICRKLILGESFERAISLISNELAGMPIAGFETYGEIALDAGDMSGFHNTTTVVLAFPQ